MLVLRASETFLNFYIPPRDGERIAFRQFFDVISGSPYNAIEFVACMCVKTCFRSIIDSNLSISERSGRDVRKFP